jgi:nitroreductase
VDTYLAITSRRDDDRYLDTPVADDIVRRILDAGRLSGSARNRQPWTFVVVAERARLQRLAEGLYEPDNARTCAFAVGILVSGKGPTSFDAGRAAQSMLLAAWNDGLLSTPNGIADEDVVRRELDAEPEERPAIVLTFGRPARPRHPERRSPEEWSERASRKPLDEVVRRLG